MKTYTNFQIFTQLLLTFIDKTEPLDFDFSQTFPDNNYKFAVVLQFDQSVDGLYLDYRDRAMDTDKFKIYRTSSTKLLMFINDDAMIANWDSLYNLYFA